LLVELRAPIADYEALAEEAAAVARAKAALPLDACVMLRKGSLPKTPSGKIQRHRCRHLLDSGRFEPLATVELAAVQR
jgi:fatty-acyl-CoA synthase